MLVGAFIYNPRLKRKESIVTKAIHQLNSTPMQSLPIASSQYHYVLSSYQTYLATLGYAASTTASFPIHVREFLHYLESVQITSITHITSEHVASFVKYIKQRGNKKRKGTALSSSSINKIINAVNSFIKYVNTTGKYILESTAQREVVDIAPRNILTVQEVKQLYAATYEPYRENSIAMGQRDRAIIAVFYGCGLRRSEGKGLNITDIDIENKRLLVRKGKGNKQRYVPIAAKHIEDLRDYLIEGRAWFLYEHKSSYNQLKYGKVYERKTNTNSDAFFINQHGLRMGEFYQRLEVMKQRAQIDTPITLHGLRHSIATHLLQSGMDIEAIAKFLGHASISSTQLYTHIVNEIKNTEDGNI
jgi:integrase/recombinase XerD